MVWIEALVPFDKGELLNTIHKVGVVEKTVSILQNAFLYLQHSSYLHSATSQVDILFWLLLQEYTESGTLIKAHVPLRFAQLLTPLRQLSSTKTPV